MHVIDLRTGDVAHRVRIEGMVSELYDVAALPGAERPKVFGFRTDEIVRTITIGDEEALWLSPQKKPGPPRGKKALVLTLCHHTVRGDGFFA